MSLRRHEPHGTIDDLSRQSFLSCGTHTVRSLQATGWGTISQRSGMEFHDADLLQLDGPSPGNVGRLPCDPG